MEAEKIVIFLKLDDNEEMETINVSPLLTLKELKEKIREIYGHDKEINYLLKVQNYEYYLSDEDDEKSLEDLDISDNDTIIVKVKNDDDQNDFDDSGDSILESFVEKNKIINIKFLKVSENSLKKYQKSSKFTKLSSILKLCILKEIAIKMEDENIEKIKLENVRNVMKILRNGIPKIDNDLKNNIKEILKKLSGSNIYTFAKYVDEIIPDTEIEDLKKLLANNFIQEISDIHKYLTRYIEYFEIFENEIERANRESFFEFAIISLAILERENLDKFEEERENCPNRVDRVLFHGTGIEPISLILTGLFKRSEKRCYQHGKGVYFSDLLDYVWFYGGKDNRNNMNKIPPIDDNKSDSSNIFTFIASSVYYDRNHFRRVNDSKYTPQKNEINFAYAEPTRCGTIKDENPSKDKFIGTEFVIWNFEQILPMLCVTARRVEYCVIWRDNNFSKDPVYNNKFDQIFKDFLKERIKYIRSQAKFNIYPCETTEEALNLIKKKKYSKIILLSNIGNDLGGKDFIEKARKIIGSDVICLFLAYNKNHLKWIPKFKNALFSNDPEFFKKYLDCFEENDSDKTKENLNKLIQELENYYNIKFNFNNDYLNYPNFKKDGKYSDLTFN